jgi:hypothetical protein
MTLSEYFNIYEGTGVLSTSDKSGRVDSAIYSRPHFTEDGKLAFIMRDRLSHENLQSNSHAVFLFKEDGPGYSGKRLFLRKVGEEKDEEKIKAIQRRVSCREAKKKEDRFLVYFELEKTLPLVGSRNQKTH